MSRVNKVFPKCHDDEEKKESSSCLPDFGTNLDYLWEICWEEGWIYGLIILFATSQKLFS